MKFPKLILGVLAICASALLSAQTATVIRMSGDKSATRTNLEGVEVPLEVGMELAEGDLVSSNANTKVFIRTFAGAITTLAADSVLEIMKVEKISDERELTRLKLKSGNVVANLDPSKRGVHDYSVDTPKGVAAARGTNFTVTVNGQETTMSVTGGSVSFQLPGGAAIDFGAGTYLPPGASEPISLTQALADPATAAQASVAVQATTNALAQIVGMGEAVTGVSTSDATTALTGVINTVAATGNDSALAGAAASAGAANPALAAAVVQTAARARPSAAAQVVATTAAAVSEETGEEADTESLTEAANNGISESNQAAPEAPPAQTITTEDVISENVEAPEVPNDNVKVTITSSFTIRLSGGRLVAVTLNNQNDNAVVALTTTPIGPQTAEQGTANTRATFTIPPEVLTQLSQSTLTPGQRNSIQAGINSAIAGPVEVTVPTDNTIVVSPSS